MDKLSADFYSLPYKSVTMWSTENTGTKDIYFESLLWTGVGNIIVILISGTDQCGCDYLLVEACLLIFYG